MYSKMKILICEWARPPAGPKQDLHLLLVSANVDTDVLLLVVKIT